MGLPTYYERSGHEYWSLKAEMDFLDRLGSHRGADSSRIGRMFTDPQRRQELLRKYIQCTTSCKHRQPWKAEAAAYAKRLLDEL